MELLGSEDARRFEALGPALDPNQLDRVLVDQKCVVEHKGWDAPSISPFFPSRKGLAVSLSGEGHIWQRAIRFSKDTDRGTHEAAERRGFSSPTAFIRHAVEQELAGHTERLATTDERLVAGIEQVKGEVVGLTRSQQALFALLDSLATILLTCIPESDIHVLEAAIARAQGRHAGLLKSAGQSMGADSRLAMQELVKHGER